MSRLGNSAAPPPRAGPRVSFDVVVTPHAVDDLDAIHRYVADHAGEDVADAYLDRIEARCRSIGDAPLTGSPRDDLSIGLRTVPFERRATIAYTVADSRVTIQRVVHAGRDLASLF